MCRLGESHARRWRISQRMFTNICRIRFCGSRECRKYFCQLDFKQYGRVTLWWNYFLKNSPWILLNTALAIIHVRTVRYRDDPLFASSFVASTLQRLKKCGLHFGLVSPSARLWIERMKPILDIPWLWYNCLAACTVYPTIRVSQLYASPC